MKIWKLKFLLDDFANIKSVENLDGEYYLSFDGRSKLDTWKKMKVTRLEQDKERPLGDAPGFFLPALNKKAVNALSPLMSGEVEILPLDFQEDDLYAINVTTVLNVIDYQNSVYRTFSDGKKIMYFIKYEFCNINLLEKHNIFKIIDEPRSYPFVSDAFKQKAEEAGLEGFNFELVWDSEEKDISGV